MADHYLRGKASELPRLALAFATLSLVGFSLVLFAQMLWLSVTLRAEFAVRNVLGVDQRLVLLSAIAMGLALPTFASVLVFWRRRGQSGVVGVLHRAAGRVAPLGIAFVLPYLFLSQVAEAKPLYYLVVLFVFGLVLSTLLTRALEFAPELKVTTWWPQLDVLLPLGARLRVLRVLGGIPLAVLLSCSAGYVLVLGRYSIAHHRLIQTVASDVGVADNVMSNLMHGHWFKAPAQFGLAAGNYLALHAEYGALLFVPIYRLRPGAETLLWLQTAIAGLAVIPLYLLAARRLGRRTAAWFGLAYLLLAPLHGALLYGFSWLPAVTLFSFTLYYAIESGRRWLMLLTLPILLSMAEAGPLNVLALGLFLTGYGKRPRLGLAFVVLAAALVAFNLELSLRGVGAADNPPLVVAVAALFQNPVYFVLDLARAAKLTSVLHALAPLCLLPLFELGCWPLLIPGLLYTFGATEFWPTGHGGYETSTVWVPGAFLALLCALQGQKEQARKPVRHLAWIAALSLTLLSHSYNFGGLLRSDGFGGPSSAPQFLMTPAGQTRYSDLMSLVRRIPASASVATTDYLLSHVSNRPEAYRLDRPYGQPDYILLSSREVSGVKSALEASFATHQYQLVAKGGSEFYLFSRGIENAETRRALSQLDLGTR